MISHRLRPSLSSLLGLVAIAVIGTGCADLVGSAQHTTGGPAAADTAAPSTDDSDTAPKPAATATPTPADDAQSVAVELDEWSVTPDVAAVSTGAVAFTARNVGRAPHEFVVVRGPLEDLPVDKDGAVDEDALPAGALVGEIEDLDAGGSGATTLDLDAGTYSLICNLVAVDGDFTESHYVFGMANEITVTAP